MTTKPLTDEQVDAMIRRNHMVPGYTKRQLVRNVYAEGMREAARMLDEYGLVPTDPREIAQAIRRAAGDA